MAGHISKRGKDTWRVRIELEPGPDGKRQAYNTTIHGKYKDADTFLTAKLRERDLGTFVRPDGSTVSEYLDKWLEVTAKQRVTKATFDQYEMILRIYGRPVIGSFNLAKVRPLNIQSLYKGMLEKGLSSRTVRYLHAILNSAFDQAIKWNLLAINPCKAVDLPKKEHKEMKSLNAEQAKAFVRAARNEDG